MMLNKSMRPVAGQAAWVVAPVVAASFLGQLPAGAFPQFADWISSESGVPVDCAYCHANRQGPEGTGPGQTGSLSAAEEKLLHTADSPILNAFGCSLMKRLSYEGVLASIVEPARLAEAVAAQDLDGDGVTDGIEMRHGTLPHDRLSAPPWLAWQARFEEHLPFVVIVALGGAVGAAGLFGLSRLLSGRER